MPIYYLAVAIIFATTIGCHSTALKAPQASSDHARLAAMATSSIDLRVSSLADPELGHQFLFVLIPFGELSHPDIAQHTMNRCAEKLAERSIHAMPGCLECPLLEISVQEASLSAFDLLFTRRVNAEIKLAAALTRKGYPSWRSEKTGSYAAFRTAPFKAELEYAIDHAIQEALTQLLDEAPLQYLTNKREW